MHNSKTILLDATDKIRCHHDRNHQIQHLKSIMTVWDENASIQRCKTMCFSDCFSLITLDESWIKFLHWLMESTFDKEKTFFVTTVRLMNVSLVFFFIRIERDSTHNAIGTNYRRF